ncbi:pyridoxamine 5'-phosphate oxidase family protein [Terracidiphilus gabretensis]|uniref:pyridoxamine 5'-phosphate oxidase family protein n=1 Tax=Terracidiphilus gabretensis TaxID=1577687 RepID=UPI00071B4DE2|nr:pyridoxamine 5'-phosphate oxidase family protein [Terracidiphilus gabretensis]
MAHTFGSLAFTTVVKELQERYGSRRQYERLAAQGASYQGLGPDEREFIGERDSFYMASIGSTGWPYVQHRGGPKGFLKVLDNQTIAFGDYRGNKQYISTGNLLTDDRVALILVDYPRQARLKILGHAKITERAEARNLLEVVRDEENIFVERVYVIHVDAFDWNCQQHITPRFTVDEIRTILAPFEERLQTLEAENARLRT